MWWPNQREDAFRSARVAAVAVWVVGLLFLAGVVLAVIYGAAVWALLFTALAIIGVVGAIMQGDGK